MWLGSRLRHESVKRIVDRSCSEIMLHKLEDNNISVQHFNICAEIIEAAVTARKEKRKYASRRLNRLMWTKCGRTFFDLMFFLMFCVLGAVLYHFIEYPLEVKATLEYDETASILKQVENLTDIATVTRIETPLIQEFQEVAALEKNMNFTRIGIYENGDPDTMVERLDFVVNEAEDSQSAPSEDGVLRWEIDTACFWALTVITTIGYGQFNPVTTPGRLFVIPYGFVGVLIAGYALLMVSITTAMGVELCFNRILPVPRIPQRSGKGLRQTMDPMTDVVSRQRIPAKRMLIVSLLYLVPYLSFFTAVFWALAEDEDWGIAEAMYYCFVTISTIGFGDFVPDDKWLFCATVFASFGLGMFCQFLMAMTELGFTGLKEFSDQSLTEPDYSIFEWLHDQTFDEPDPNAKHQGIDVAPGKAGGYVLMGDKDGEKQSLMGDKQ